jgi:hypothetical protein
MSGASRRAVSQENLSVRKAGVFCIGRKLEFGARTAADELGIPPTAAVTPVYKQQGNAGSQSKGGTAVCRAGLEAAGERRSYSAGESADECSGQAGDYRRDKEALGGHQGGEGCCSSVSGCSGTQDRTSEDSGASQERRPDSCGTKGAVHRNEETVGSEKKGGGQE